MADSFNHIHHLFRRAGFGFSPEEWKQRSDWTLVQGIDHLFMKTKLPDIPTPYSLKNLPSKEMVKQMSDKEKKELKRKGKQLQIQQIKEWVESMASADEYVLLEKMTLFWHGHFACIIKGQPHLSLQYLNTLRRHALGNFRDMVLAVAKDPAMIRFLNNQQNRKKKPNENFARELLELFTIGRGNYTEKDIKEAARAFTGWSSDYKGNYIFRKRQHDFGTKTFMGKTGDFNGEDIVDIVLDKPETAQFVAEKIYRFFINDIVDEKRVEELGKYFYAQNYDIEKLMRYIFSSNWFYSSEHQAAKIKSPIELLVGIMKAFKVEFSKGMTIRFIQKALGQELLHPPNVAGWPGGKAWMDHSTLMLRLNFTGYLFQATEVSFRVKEELKDKKRNKVVRKIDAYVDLKPLLNVFSPYDETELIQKMSDYFLVIHPAFPQHLFNQYLIRQNKEDFIKSLALRLTSLPEYQLS